MLVFWQDVVAVSATLLTAQLLLARTYACSLATRTLCRQFRMDSPLDLESPPTDGVSRQQFSYAATPSPRRAFPHATRTTSHDRVTRDGPLRHN